MQRDIIIFVVKKDSVLNVTVLCQSLSQVIKIKKRVQYQEN
jgi:hypothetical protein